MSENKDYSANGLLQEELKLKKALIKELHAKILTLEDSLLVLEKEMGRQAEKRMGLKKAVKALLRAL